MKDLMEIFNTPFKGSSCEAYNNMRQMAITFFGIHLIPTNDTSVRLQHLKLCPQSPEEIQGVTYPNNFKVLRQMSKEKASKAESVLMKLISSNSEDAEMSDFLTLVAPLLTTVDTSKKPPIQMHVERMSADTSDFVDNSDESSELFPEASQISYPQSFVPKDEWFAESLEELTISDILHIWPEPEQEALALCIGRALVGCDGDVMPQSKTKVVHAFRQMAIVYGPNAGTGKSTFFNLLLKALTKVGYEYAAFQDLGQQFGVGEIVTKDFAYCDDLNERALKNLLGAPLVKQIITGNEMRAHIKFAEDKVVKPRCVIFANVNNFNPGVLYGLDNGISSRLLLLTTRSDQDIDGLPQSGNLPKLSQGSPDLRTRPHLIWLANKLEVSIDAIMLKFARLCAVKFLEQIQANTLESTFNSLRSKFATQLPDSYDLSTLELLIFCYRLREGKDPANISGANLVKMFMHFNFVMNDRRANCARNLLKADYLNKGKPANHLFSPIKFLDEQTVDICFRAGDALPTTTLMHTDKTIKAVFENLRLANGFSFPSNVAHIKNYLMKYRANRSSDYLITQIKKNCLDSDLLDPTKVPKVAEIYDINFNRELRAKELNNEA